MAGQPSRLSGNRRSLLEGPTGWLPRGRPAPANRLAIPLACWCFLLVDSVELLQMGPHHLDRGGRLGLNSVSVPIDGFLTDPVHRLPLRGTA